MPALEQRASVSPQGCVRGPSVQGGRSGIPEMDVSFHVAHKDGVVKTLEDFGLSESDWWGHMATLSVVLAFWGLHLG